MEVSMSEAKPPTSEDLKELDSLKALIEQATADGLLTAEEIQGILAVITDRGAQHSAQQVWREINLYRTLCTEKVRNGELASGLLGNWGMPLG